MLDKIAFPVERGRIHPLRKELLMSNCRRFQPLARATTSTTRIVVGLTAGLKVSEKCKPVC